VRAGVPFFLLIATMGMLIRPHEISTIDFVRSAGAGRAAPAVLMLAVVAEPLILAFLMPRLLRRRPWILLALAPAGIAAFYSTFWAAAVLGSPTLVAVALPLMATNVTFGVAVTLFANVNAGPGQGASAIGRVVAVQGLGQMIGNAGGLLTPGTVPTGTPHLGEWATLYAILSLLATLNLALALRTGRTIGQVAP
jgi:hypothetical protein